MVKAVFLDRDGTINIDKGYLYKIKDFEYCRRTYKALRSIQDLGYKLFIITNQSGIGRGYYTERQLQNLHKWLVKDLKSNGINITKIYYCPHYVKSKIVRYRKKCQCRKPNLKLFYKAIKEFNIDVNLSVAIGDKVSDLSICNVSKCKGILISKNVKQNNKQNFYIAHDIFDASLIVKRLSNNKNN